MSQLSATEISAFQTYIYRFFEQAGRHALPWRQTCDPYCIMVSEIMLQQTQVERVIPKFKAFLTALPTFQALADASVAEVIRHWQGLGYNRRGLNLQKAAQAVVLKHQGQLPTQTEALVELPGIGPYTAAAIQAFAFNLPSLVIETNIRTVFIYHFFLDAYQVHDRDILLMIEATLDTSQPRHWYSALMDYGSYLKQHVPNPTRQSKTYAKQSKFIGSNRQVRGEILKTVSQTPALTYQQLREQLSFSQEKVDAIVGQLVKEGFLVQENDKLRLAGDTA